MSNALARWLRSARAFSAQGEGRTVGGQAGTTIASPAARPRRRRSNALTLAMALMLVYTLLPLFWLVVSSTKDSGSLFSSFGLWFSGGFHLFSNIHQVLTYDHGIYLRWFANSALYAVVGACGAALIAAVGGYALAKYRFRGRRVLSAVVNTPWAVLIPSLASPFGLYLMQVYAAEAVPDSLLEAARIDGCGEIRTFFTISLRILAPGFVTVLLFALVATWNNYFLPLIVLSDPHWFPLTVGLNQWNALASGQVGAGASTTGFYPMVVTGSLLAIIPLVIAFLCLQRFWQAGLAAGNVKQ